MSKSRHLISIVALTVLGVALLTFPTLIRALPGRYAYYLPEPLQELRHNPHPDLLPTPVVDLDQLSPSPTPLPTPLPTSTPLPSATLVLPPTETPSPSPTLPARFVLTGVNHEHQGWNNCGLATLGMALSYWGCSDNQYDIAPVLKPDPEDKNVSPWEMAAYTEDLGLEALIRVNGTLERLKTLVRAGFPTIVETWYVRDARDQLGHYRLIVGYDEAAQQFITYDSLHGPDVTISYQELGELWRVFNRLYIVAYAPERRDALTAILGPDRDDAAMYEQAMQTALAEMADAP